MVTLSEYRDANFLHLRIFTLNVPRFVVVKSPPDISTDRTTSGPGRIQDIN